MPFAPSTNTRNSSRKPARGAAPALFYRRQLRLASIAELHRLIFRLGFLLSVLVHLAPASGDAQPTGGHATCEASAGSSLPAHGQGCALDGSASDDPGVLAIPGAPETAGNPVDLITGHKRMRRLHLHSGMVAPDRFGQGLALVLTLHYNSAERGDRGFGPGWRHGFDLRLRASLPAPGRGVDGLQVEISQADGSRLVYGYDKARAVFAAPHAEWGEIHSFDAGANRRWIWRQPGGRTAHFDAQGRLTAWDSLLGHRLELHYDAMGDLTRVERRVTPPVDRPADRPVARQVDRPMDRPVNHPADRPVSAASAADESRASLALLRDPASRRIRKAMLLRDGVVAASCHYRYRDGGPGDMPLVQAVCNQEPPRAPGTARSQQPPGVPVIERNHARTLQEAYVHEDPRFPDAITGVIRTAQPQPPRIDLASERSIYRYDAAARVIYSQGIGESPQAAIKVEYSERERRLTRGAEEAIYTVQAQPGPDGERATGLRLRRADAAVCMWCPGVTSQRLDSERDEVGRILTVRDRDSRRILERRSYANGDRIALPETIERPSVRPGAFARSHFTRDASGLLIAFEHTGFRPIDIDGQSRISGFAPLQRKIRLRYRTDGEGLGGAYIANLSPQELDPNRIQIPLVVPGNLEPANRWHGAQRWMDDFGRTVLIRHATGGVSRAIFDALDRISGSQGPSGLQTELRWNDESLPLATHHEGGGRTHYHWERTAAGDALLREASTQAGVRGAPGVAIRWTYDGQGRVATRTHQIGSRQYRWTLERDSTGRVVKEHLPDGGALVYRYDEEGLLELRYRHGTLLGQLLYRRLATLSAPADGSVRYQIGAQEVVWKPRIDDLSALARLDVGALATWALRESPPAAAPADRQLSPPSRQRWSDTSGSHPRFAPLQPHASGSHGWVYDAASRWLGDGPSAAPPAPTTGAPGGPPPGESASDTESPGLTRQGRELAAAALRMHYDPLGMPAMLTQGDSHGQQIVMDGWRPLLFANRFGSLQGLVIWVGSLPVAWIQSGHVYHLAVDWRGAPTHAFTPEGRIVWRASYLEPLLPQVDARTLRRNTDGRSLRRKTTREQVQVPLGVAGRWMADPKLVKEDPRLAPLLFGAFRVLDGTQGRFLQPDPLGPAGDRDPYAYADARPWQYVDPWGLARLTYFAILQSERHTSGLAQSVGAGGGAAAAALRTHQGFAIGRWSFLLESIAPASRAPETSAGTLSALQNNYAQHKQSLLFDAQGSFRLSQQDPLVGNWFGNDTLRFDASDGQEVMSSFRAHYGASLITRSAFVVEDFDDQQATRLMALLSRDRAARTQCMSPSNLWLPPLMLGERSAPIQPDAPQGQGNTVQRMLRCDGALAGIPEPILQSLYANPLEGSRVERLQAAAQLQEAPAPSSITPVCSADGCRTRTAIEVNGRKYYASYGSTQFVMESFLRTLRKDVLSGSGLDPRTLGWLRLDQTITDAQGKPIALRQWVDQGIARAVAAARAFDDVRARFGKGLSESEASRRWQTMTSAQQQQWMLGTGLDSRAFVDMLGFLPDGRARTEAEARNAFAAEAVLRLGQDQGARGRFGDWLIGLFSDSARFGFVSRLFLRNHLRKVLSEPRLQGLLAGAGTASPVASTAAPVAGNAAPVAGNAAPGSANVSTAARLAASPAAARSLQVEAEIAYRVALMHNGGEGAPGALDPAGSPPPYLRQYAEEFMRRAGRGNWEALRCLEHLEVAGLQMQTLRLA